MTAGGRYLEIMRAVLPLSVKTAMAPMGRSSAAWAIDSQMVSAMERPRRSRRRGCVNSAMLLSASMIMRDMMATASRGYRPLAVSADNITASVPSKTALATSLASGRVGGGVSADDMLLNHRNFLRRNFHAQITARHHDAVRDFKDFLEMVNGLRFFKLCDHRDVAGVACDDLFSHLH